MTDSKEIGDIRVENEDFRRANSNYAALNFNLFWNHRREIEIYQPDFWTNQIFDRTDISSATIRLEKQWGFCAYLDSALEMNGRPTILTYFESFRMHEKFANLKATRFTRTLFAK